MSFDRLPAFRHPLISVLTKLVDSLWYKWFASVDEALKGDQTVGPLAIERFTTTQRDELSNVLEGTVLYNSTTNKLNLYNGSAWEEVTSA